jgi:hypothetical protein
MAEPSVVEFRLAKPRAQAALDGAPFHRWVSPDGAPWAEFHRATSGYLLRFPDLADYQVTADGTQVLCQPSAGVADETIRHLYLNQVLPLALSRLGKLVFHASAVEIAGGGIAFIGESGRGKSTLAAGFATGGHRFLTDDGLVVEARGGGYDVQPSHPSIRLWRDSQEALVRHTAPAAERVPFTAKVRFLADESIAFCNEPRPLARVFFLGDGATGGIVIAPMSASDALIELVKHSFLLDIQARDLIAVHFDQLSRMVSQRIYYRLDYPRRFEMLGEVQGAILRHCGP